MYIYVYTYRVTCTVWLKFRENKDTYVCVFIFDYVWMRKEKVMEEFCWPWLHGRGQRSRKGKRVLGLYILHHWACYEDHALLSESETIKWRQWFIISKYFAHSYILSISMLHSGNGKSSLQSNIPLIHALHTRVWTQKGFHGPSSAPLSYRVNYVLIIIFPDTIGHMAKATQQASGEA